MTSFLAITFSKAYFHFLALALYPSLFCYLHLSSDLFYLSIVFGFSFSSCLVFGHKYGHKYQGSQGHHGLPLPTSLAKEFSCYVRFCLVEVSKYKVMIRSFIYQRGQRCKSTAYIYLPGKSFLTGGIIQLLEVKPASLLIITMLWSLSTSAHEHVLVLAALVAGRNHLNHIMKKNVFTICEQQWCRSACASAQFDMRLCCSCLDSIIFLAFFYLRNFMTLARLCT